MAATTIEWCDHSINPIRARLKATGAVGHYCEKITSGCTNCYSSTMQQRFQMPSFGGGQKRDDVEIFLDESKLLEVRRRRKPTRYFWCDMTDFFGEWMRQEWLEKCFATMDTTPQHTHVLLTKRPENIRRMWPDNHAPMGPGEYRRALAGPGNVNARPNVWLGCSVSDQATADEAIPHLLKSRDLSPVLFLSAEPLLSAIELSDVSRRADAVAQVGRPALSGISWLIVGGESGHNARPCHVDWIRSIVRQCAAASVPCFVKQIGASPVCREQGPMTSGADWDSGAGEDREILSRLVDRKGGDPAEWPGDLRVRQMPVIQEVTP